MVLSIFFSGSVYTENKVVAAIVDVSKNFRLGRPALCCRSHLYIWVKRDNVKRDAFRDFEPPTFRLKSNTLTTILLHHTN